MKNLLHLRLNTGEFYEEWDKLELLPFRENRWQNWVRTKGNYWNFYDYKKCKTYHPWKIVKRILHNNIGKSFDLTFHYYCTLVPKHEQHWFLDEFFNSYRHKYYYNTWSLDENNNIVFNHKKEKKIYSFTSDDYKTLLVHKTTGHFKNQFTPKYSYKLVGKYKKYRTEILEYYSYKNQYKAQDSDFEPVVVSGFEMSFESKNDRRFKKLLAERKSKNRKKERENKKLKEQKEYSFLSKSEIQLKKDKLLDIQKIISHGFDPETSFRNNKIHIDL